MARRGGNAGRTTIDSSVQDAALTALDGAPNSGEIVAVRASTGEIWRSPSTRRPGALPADGALNAKLAPGTAFHHRVRGRVGQEGCVALHLGPVRGFLHVGGQTFTSEGTVS